MPPVNHEAINGYQPANNINNTPVNPWEQPSSPEMSSPEIEPLVANLLHSINNAQHLQQQQYPQDLESPEPEQQQNQSSTGAPLPKSPRSRRDSQATPKSRAKGLGPIATQESRLLAMPAIRALPWRDNVDPGGDIETGGDSRRKQIRFGCLLATRGKIQQNQCLSCVNGRGKFNQCIALEGFFKGACASCQLSGRPNRCSIKVDDDEADDPDTITAAVPAPPSAPKPRKRKETLKKRESTMLNETPEAKRRRTADKVPEWENARPRWEQELGDSQARQQMNEIAQRPWATVNHPVPPAPQAVMGDANGVRNSPHSAVAQRNSMGWATVNLPTQPSPLKAYHKNGSDSNGPGFRSSFDQSAREETAPNDDGTPLIDMLPKNKQRLVYGLVSGLQGGIEHLQRELDSLKRALGIDDEV